MSFDLIVRGGSLVTPEGVRRADLGISGGQIVEISEEITAGGNVLDASGLHILPGVLDAHVHLNEPGRTHWEGFETGTRALAAGGATSFFDMPLNSSPPVLDKATFEAKRELGEQKSLIDFGLWGGLTPLNLDRMRPNLATLDAGGAIQRRQELDPALAQNSIRHLALLDDAVAFAMQWQGDAAEPVPLLGIAGPDGLALCPAPEAEAFAMQGYAGSIASAGPEGIVVTSPRGGVAMIYDPSGSHRATLRRADVCGAAPGTAADAAFLLTDGGGAIWAADASGLRLIARHDLSWDNHLVTIG